MDNPPLLPALPKPSKMILDHQEHECKIYASEANRIPRIIELIRDSDIEIQNCRVPFEETLFRPEPPNLVLEKFVPFRTYELVFSFRNMDKVPRKIRIEDTNSIYFSVHGWKNKSLQSEKIAPGMEVSYVVKFKPEENVDYIQNLVCVTEREKFIVPIKAVGARGVLDFPDQVEFQEVPVQLSSSKTLLVKNVGEVTAKFKINSEEPFKVSPEQGSVNVGDTMQIEVEFNPKHVGTFTSFLHVLYNSGDETRVELLGSSININLRLDKTSVRLENSITLTGSKSIKISNRSDHLVKYVWKLCANVAEEEHLKAKQKLEILSLEQNEINSLTVKSAELAGLALLRQKYRNMVRETQSNTYPFSNEVFRIEPNSGIIWPRSCVDVNIYFTPMTVGAHNAIAYCQVEGRETRLPLQLKGTAVGPKAKFAFTSFSVNEVFINTHHQYEILLENLGNIPTSFSLRKSDSLFGPQFTFKPNAGIIRVGEQVLIEVIFEPKTLGTFNETFYWELEGNTDPLHVSYEGVVIGPTFKFDVEKIVLPPSSFGFVTSQSFELINTSSIPMIFELEVGEEGDNSDFTINPTSGVLAENSSCPVEIKFLPTKLQDYDNYISVSVQSVGQDLLRLPIETRSVVPTIKIKDDLVDLGDCFIDYSYFQTITLVNESNFWAKFKLDEKDNAKNLVYSVEFESLSGIIEPFSEVAINTRIRLKRVGSISFPIFIRIHGNEDSPLAFNLTATGIGPEVILDIDELNWEKIPVLTTVSKELFLKNRCPIPASVSCDLVNGNACFTVDPSNLVIEPGATAKVIISAYLDDSTLFSDVLKVTTQCSGTDEILLSARGVGSTVVYDQELTDYHFPDVFSNRECSTSFTMYNKGRRTQHLHWLHATSKDPAIQASQIFEVIPARFTLRPGTHQVVFFKGYSNVPIKIVDKIACYVTTEKSSMRKVLVEAVLHVEFIVPLLLISPTNLHFMSTHTTDDSFHMLTQNLEFKNDTSLSVTANLRCPRPFLLQPAHHTIELKAGESTIIPVSFDPSHNLSRISTKENGKLYISYKEHPQKDHVPLHSEVFFPNLTFSTNQVQFGCIPNNLEQRKVFTMKNTSTLPVIYYWYFLSDNNTSSGDIGQAFDFKPIRGVIQPQEVEEVCVFFYGHPNAKFHISAICDVAGGPKYELLLGGEAADYKYSFDSTVLDFGINSYQTISEQELVLSNTGNVNFDFEVKIFAESGLIDKCMVYPAKGMISKGTKQKFVVRFCSCVPENVDESIYVQIAHFEPIEIKIKSETTFPSIRFNIPIANRIAQDENDRPAQFEADRLYLKSATMQYLCDLKIQTMSNFDPEQNNYVGSSILFSKTPLGKNYKEHKQEPKSMSLYEVSNVNQATYTFDIGNCVRNTATKKTITVINNGMQPVTFTVSKTALLNGGFVVEPEKVKNLPPGESLDLSISFLAKTEEHTVELDLPISIQGGPVNIIHLKAGIATPSICLLREGVCDFGEVLTGYRKNLIVQLHNPSMVPAEWAARLNSEEPAKSKKKKVSVLKDFDILPSSGVLQPQEKALVLVRFFPTEQRLYDMNIPIKVQMNPKVYNIKVQGNGVLPAIVFDPQNLILGPVLPLSDGCENKITVQNTTNHPLEFFSVDFDLNYKQEEEALKLIDGLENGCLYLQPKDLQVSFSEYLADQQKKRLLMEKESFGGYSEVLKYQHYFTVANPDSQSTQDQVTNVIIHGPPYSGKTTQAKKIAAIYNKKYLTLDEIIESSPQFIEFTNKKIREESVVGATPTDEETKPRDESKPILTEEAMYEILKQYFLSLNYSAVSGVVIDSLECKYITNYPFILKSLIKCLLEKGRKLLFFHFTLELQKIKDREQEHQNMITEQELATLRVRELSEEEYDVLNETQKRTYDVALLKYKKRAKEIEDRRHKDRRLQDGDSYQRKGERKLQDDRKNKGGRQMNLRTPNMEKNEKPTSSVPNKPGKKPGSPKLGKKTGLEKPEKHLEKELKHPDKETMDDPLAEVTFIKDTTYQKVENYLTSIDSTLAVLKDGKEQEKAPAVQTKPVVGPAATTEKKGKVAKGAQNEPIIQAVVEDSNTAEDSNTPEFREYNTGLLDEDAVYKSVTELIPIPVKDEEPNLLMKHLNEFFMEKIYRMPPDREKHVYSKVFSIIVPNAVSENEIESTEPTSTAPPAKAVEQKTEKVDSKKNAKPVKQADEKVAEVEEESEKDLQNTYRWTLNPGEKKEFLVRFNPVDAAKFESNLTFELIGGGSSFHLPCNGICEYSHIVTDLKKIFPKIRKSKEEKEIIHGEFILASSTFEFGPLLYNKPKDKFQEIDNRIPFNIINPTNAEIKVDFLLKNDIKSDTFSFDPPTMTLPPGKSQVVTVSAFPKTATTFEDTFFICIQDNPEPFMFKISCIGVKPELELDRKTFAFDRLLLGRGERREIKLKNPTYLPVSWRFMAVESLGDEFTITPTEGVVSSFSDMIVTAEFKAAKSLMIKKLVKIEVTDIDKIAGVVQEIPVLVTAESYDISMDAHFPRGLEGGLDFGTLKVFEEGKQLVTLKNKGKYEVGFRFLFDSLALNELITVTPPHGLIQPSEKPFFVQIVFKTATEIAFKELPLLKCIVFEPSTGEVTASIPVKVSARAVFSKFSVVPLRDLNFGALVHGTKVTKQFILENTGEFDFKFSIFKIIPRLLEKSSKPATSSAKLPGSRPRPTSPPPMAKTNVNKKELATKGPDSVSFGAFSVTPTSGVVQSGVKQVITVDFHSENPGLHEETIGIDISDRSPADNGDVLEYQLIGESCIPGINTTDYASIFEEQSVCKHLEVFKFQSTVYCEEDRVFYYGAYLAGEQGSVQFKISNPFKVPCDVALSTKPRGKSKSEVNDFAFEVEPKKLTIPSHEHRMVTVTFHPTSIQNYSGVFEALVENVAEGKNKCLTFELRGEGTLPRVLIEKPTIKSRTGAPWVKFRRLLVGTSQTIPIVLRNDGIIPANVKIEWVFKDNEDFYCNMLNCYQNLKPGEVRNIDVKCQPSSIKKLEGELRLKVQDNSFEDSVISVSGEGYVDDFTIEDLGDEIENEIAFMDCSIGESKTVTFKVKNHSPDWIRASFNDTPDFTFTPSLMHIRPMGQRDIAVNYCPKQPISIQHAVSLIKVAKVKFSNEPEIEWDDRLKIVKWGYSNNSGAAKKIIESIPEPPNDSLIPVNDYQLLLNAFADYCSYECDVTSIQFKTTLMYQNRVFRFPLKNSGKVSLQVNFMFFDADNTAVEIEETVFSVNPKVAKILPGEMVMVSVKFSPLDIGQYHAILLGHISNLQKDQKKLQIDLSGSSQRPYCHFELEDINPLSIESRTPERSLNNGVPFALEPNTKIIEFYSCGVKTKTIRKFYIVNPTQNSYEYQWKMESLDMKVFRCLTPKGTVAPNKKSEIVFEFTSENLDVKESLWSFVLAEYSVRIPFLLIGYSQEPNLNLNQNSVNFKSVLVGRKAKETISLINNESVPFAFSFNDSSIEMDPNGIPVFKISPNAGIVEPKAEQTIEISFMPTVEKAFCLNLSCNIKKKPTHVNVIVKGEGYEIHDRLETELLDGTFLNLLHGIENEYLIDYGVVQLNEKRVRRMFILNTGKFNFAYSWKFAKQYSGLTIHPEVGTVVKGERLMCEITFCPNVVSSLNDVKLVCQIQNGKSYHLSINGSGAKPFLNIVPTALDFEFQFLHRGNILPITKILEVTNNDNGEMSIEFIAGDLDWLDFEKGAFTLNQGETKQVPFTFYPREAKVYQTNLKVEINGIAVVEVPVSGEGCEVKIETDIQTVNFGSLRIGSSNTKTVKIYNRSKIATPLSIGPLSTIQHLSSLGCNFIDLHEYVIKPKGNINLEIKFQPHRRIATFTEDISTEFAGITRKLFMITGSCQGIEVRLENDTLPFGAVSQKSFTVRKLQIQNVGDIGAKFSWDVQKLGQDFTINPREGYLSPGMELPLEITFHPVELNIDIRANNVPCKIEGLGKLYLTLTGSCVPQPSQIDILKYSTPVRTPETKGIVLTNRSSMNWVIKPIIDNDSWSGPEIIEVESGQSKSYDLTFFPAETMGLGEGGRHEGTIFFPLPDGTGLLYKLHGMADKVLPNGTISRDLPSKTYFTEVLYVPNWLRKTQRLRVYFELAKPDPATIFRGPEFIDLISLQTKEYRYTYFAYKEGTANFKVIFKNENTQEYIFYNVNYKNLPSGVISTIEFTSPIRQVQCKEVTITNPLLIPAVFSSSCTNGEITVPHTFTIQPKSEMGIPIEYQPLHPKDATAKLTLSSQELGNYTYDLKLQAVPAANERSINFKVGLGGMQVQTFRFFSFAKQRTDYTCKIESTEFSVEKSISAPAAQTGGVEISVDITYEPSRLGDSQAMLIITSPVGGDYVCPLIGHCLSPKPQGPIIVKAGNTSSVQFKNVFLTNATFNCVVDNPAFIVKAAETIPSKKTIALSIGFKQSVDKAGNPNQKTSQLKTGKLTVTNPVTNISWMYYLKYSAN